MLCHLCAHAQPTRDARRQVNAADWGMGFIRGSGGWAVLGKPLEPQGIWQETGTLRSGAGLGAGTRTRWWGEDG